MSDLLVTGDVVRTVTLHRPDASNALDEALYTDLVDLLDAVASDSTVRAVVLTGSGNAFSAGGDRAFMRAMQDDRALRERTIENSRRLFDGFASLDVPVVAAVNGPAVGAGYTLALLCDVIFIAEDAYLADPHLRVGLVPGDGGVVLWPLLAGLPAARAYLLTGDRLPAAEAYRLGVVHRVVSAGALLDETRHFAERVAALPATAVRDTKRALNLHLTHAAETTFDVASEAEARSFDSVEHRRLTSETG